MSSEKKPVGFATHLTAGGIAGAMEAVRTLAILRFLKVTTHLDLDVIPVVLPTP